MEQNISVKSRAIIGRTFFPVKKLECILIYRHTLQKPLFDKCDRNRGLKSSRWFNPPLPWPGAGSTPDPDIRRVPRKGRNEKLEACRTRRPSPHFRAPGAIKNPQEFNLRVLDVSNCLPSRFQAIRRRRIASRANPPTANRPIVAGSGVPTAVVLRLIAASVPSTFMPSSMVTLVTVLSVRLPV